MSWHETTLGRNSKGNSASWEKTPQNDPRGKHRYSGGSEECQKV